LINLDIILLDHGDGTIWAKGTIADDQPDGYWNGFEKAVSVCVQDILIKANRLENGQPMMQKERFIK